MMIFAKINGKNYSFTHNILINNYTSFEDYYSKVSDHITTTYGEGYGLDVVNTFIIKCWNLDDLRNKKIKVTKEARGLTPSFKNNEFFTSKKFSNLKKSIFSLRKNHYSTTSKKTGNFISPSLF